MQHAIPFTEQITQWLASWPVTVVLMSHPQSPFALVRVAKAGRADVVLHLVDLPTWQRVAADFPATNFSNISQYFRSQGLVLIHLWEDVWFTKRPVVESRLLALLGISERIPARVTQVRRIDRPTTEAFLAHNHTQVVTLSKYKYGLFLPPRYYRILSSGYLQQEALPPDELLVAVATFSHPRTIVRSGQPYRSCELVRFANRLHTTVVGGLDKLLKAFEQDQQPDDIMTYADLDWSEGGSYQRLGFEAADDTPPQEFWLDTRSLIRHYPHRLPEGNTLDQSLVKVYNSGSRKYIKLLSK
ncbi:hypothetical protein [Telluribacter sp. SYSU D00476]|uniref:hypothetical protein n=1 Tax=Telluribacter sp. SYSU D00476 TaxID=2811430 RepID=UPI001FF56461|nr:hypothetical protein [Telluribacter sp. SYSU D00476]